MERADRCGLTRAEHRPGPELRRRNLDSSRKKMPYQSATGPLNTDSGDFPDRLSRRRWRRPITRALRPRKKVQGARQIARHRRRPAILRFPALPLRAGAQSPSRTANADQHGPRAAGPGPYHRVQATRRRSTGPCPMTTLKSRSAIPPGTCRASAPSRPRSRHARRHAPLVQTAELKCCVKAQGHRQAPCCRRANREVHYKNGRFRNR